MEQNKDTRNIEALTLKKKKSNRWILEIFLLSLCLAILFALISELMLSHTSLALAFMLIVILTLLSVSFDLIGTAVTACNIKPFLEYSKRQEKGADRAIKLIKNAEKVSCICTDVVGDICSILSGAGGVSITVLVMRYFPSFNMVIVSIIINSLIASITILGKAIGKTYALANPTKVVLRVGKMLEFAQIKPRQARK